MDKQDLEQLHAEFGLNLKIARLRCGLSQTVAAAALHVEQSTVSRWENGKCLPNPLQLFAILDLYEVKVDELRPS